jgi:hypothetical protein
MYTSQAKRKHNYQQDSYPEQVLDDLAFAATFAIVPTELPRQAPTKVKVEVKEDDSSNDASGNHDENKMRDVQGLDEDEDSSSDESDVDLSEELARMEKEDEPKKASQNSRIVVPTTQNEVDIYNCPIKELEKKLDLNLGVSDVLLFRPSDVGVMHAKITPDRIRLAGHIKFHMISDRTIVVESCPESGASSHISSLLLDEGSILLLKMSKHDEILTKNQLGSIALADNEVCVVPLGKILEVFGPVAKPLYTLRLVNSSLSKSQDEKSSTDSAQMSKDDNLSPAGEEKDSDVKEGNLPVTEEGAEKNGEETRVEEEIVKSEVKNVGPVAETRSDPEPWSKDGALTEWIKLETNFQVYYSEDQVKFVDTQSVVRNSRKGCGKLKLNMLRGDSSFQQSNV